MEKPKIITLCGSSRFCDIMAVCAWLLERDEGVVTMGLHLLPVWYTTKCDDHLAEAEGVAKAMDALHMKKIDMSDEIFVVNFQDYFGKSTQNEIKYATLRNKPVRWFTHDSIGYKVQDMINGLVSPTNGEGKGES